MDSVKPPAAIAPASPGGSTDDLPYAKVTHSPSVRERFRSLVLEQRATQEETPRNANREVPVPYAGMYPFHAAHTAMPAGNDATSSQAPAPASDELSALLQRVCSDIYVGAPSSGSSRVLLALDSAIPGAAAELVREGVFLRVRLHARNDAAYRSMSARREQLGHALDNGAGLRIEIEVIRDEDAGYGSTD